MYMENVALTVLFFTDEFNPLNVYFWLSSLILDQGD
jgi:hypothetical protein